jgi:hypothetical protein
MIEKQSTTRVQNRLGWRFDMENAPRDMAKWIMLALRTPEGNRLVANGRWSVDRWMTPAGFVSGKAVYAWCYEIPPPEEPEDDGVDASILV